MPLPALTDQMVSIEAELGKKLSEIHLEAEDAIQVGIFGLLQGQDVQIEFLEKIHSALLDIRSLLDSLDHGFDRDREQELIARDRESEAGQLSDVAGGTARSGQGFFTDAIKDALSGFSIGNLVDALVISFGLWFAGVDDYIQAVAIPKTLANVAAFFKNLATLILRPFHFIANAFNGITAAIRGSKVFAIIGTIANEFKAIGTMLSKFIPFLPIIKLALKPFTFWFFALWDFIKGFIDGFSGEDGTFLKGLSAGFKEVLIGSILKPLDLLKDGIAWVLDQLGFTGAKEVLDSFSFEGALEHITDFVSKLFEDFFGTIFDLLIDLAKKSAPGRIAGFITDKMGVTDTVENITNKIRNVVSNKEEVNEFGTTMSAEEIQQLREKQAERRNRDNVQKQREEKTISLKETVEKKRMASENLTRIRTTEARKVAEERKNFLSQQTNNVTNNAAAVGGVTGEVLQLEKQKMEFITSAKEQGLSETEIQKQVSIYDKAITQAKSKTNNTSLMGVFNKGPSVIAPQQTLTTEGAAIGVGQKDIADGRAAQANRSNLNVVAPTTDNSTVNNVNLQQTISETPPVRSFDANHMYNSAMTVRG